MKHKLYHCGNCENGKVKGQYITLICPYCGGTGIRKLTRKEAHFLNLREVKR